MIVEAKAKINLHLAVGKRRKDGFHNIESIFVMLDIADTLDFQIVDDKKSNIQIEMSDEAIPLEQNIIYKAVTLLREKTNFSDSVKIKVTKKIPNGAGLGGASSDAAATLKALNKKLDKHALLKMAEILGSDVPFFIEGGAAYISGRGEIIENIDAPHIFAVLINPQFKSITADAYKLLDVNLNNKINTNTLQNKTKLISMLQNNPRNWAFCNDFLNVFLLAGTDKEKAAYTSMLSDLKNNGADFANLSGSGSTCFGIFTNKQNAEDAALKLSKKWAFVKLASSC
jgi:4-diphosphocytidyl-2-C-methyl-D-erythritol kinase